MLDKHTKVNDKGDNCEEKLTACQWLEFNQNTYFV